MFTNLSSLVLFLFIINFFSSLPFSPTFFYVVFYFPLLKNTTHCCHLSKSQAFFISIVLSRISWNIFYSLLARSRCNASSSSLHGDESSGNSTVTAVAEMRSGASVTLTDSLMFSVSNHSSSSICHTERKKICNSNFSFWRFDICSAYCGQICDLTYVSLYLKKTNFNYLF